MRIAIEGCTHGELDKTYETIVAAEKQSGKKVDLLICCGDFQSTRNLSDLQCMAVPDKYKDMCSFYKYYSGEKKAPVLTVFIGGNHEASNYLQELPYGGWVAPNIYFMGYAGVVVVNGLRIGGLSGIYKGNDYLRGHFESPPYSEGSVRSVYHIRNLEVFRLKQLASCSPDIMLSHDWPRGIYHYGDVDQLLRWKKHFQEDIQNDQLGSRPTQELLETLKPHYWFSAHLHVKFPAVVDHHNGGQTKFLALDKCLPRRKFLQILDIGDSRDDKEEEELPSVKFEYDAAWLAVLRSTKHLLSVEYANQHMPGPGYAGKHDFSPTETEVDEVRSLFDGDLAIPQNFVQTVSSFDPQTETVKDLYRTPPPSGPQRNSQTVAFCTKLGIDDPCEVLVSKEGRQMMEASFSNASASDEKSTFLSMNADEIPLDDDEDAEEGNGEASTSSCPQSESLPKRLSMSLPAPKNDADDKVRADDETPSGGFVIDATPEVAAGPTQGVDEPPKKKTLKRRNHAIYEVVNILNEPCHFLKDPTYVDQF